MKRFLLFVFSIFLSYSIAIAQDGINYQGAATDVNGDELTNQNISIRASVLSTSANGNLEWEETHSATTDQFGLFNVVIGQGTNTTNGATATFDDMDWGSGNHFLKIEMDATGGTNYAMIGTTQMMSVPYALYAKSAGIDSTMLANMIGSSGGGMGGGCDFNYPDGLEGFAVTQEVNLSTAYVVPTGKRLYVVSWRNDNPVIDGITVSFVGGAPLILNAGESLTSGISSILWSSFNGYLVDQNIEINSITQEVNLSTAYVVPTGKRLYVVSWRNDNPVIDGITVSFVGGAPLILNAGESLTSGISSILWSSFNGYLVDENYFAACGGGGSSSSASAVDSAMVAGMIANAGGGGSSFGDIITINSSIENQAQQDGFLYGQYYLGGPSDSWIKVYCDTFSGNTNIRGYYENNPYGGNFDVENTFMIPIKQGEFYSFASGGWGPPSINNVYFVPLESGGGSSSASAGLDSATVATMIANAVSATNSSISVSQYGDTLYINGQAIVIPGVSQSNLNMIFNNYGSVTDVDGNTYKTLEYGNNEWMVENLKTQIGNYSTVADQIGTVQTYVDSIGYYYAASDVTSNVCPSGWHVATILDWQDLHYEIYGTNMNPNGYTSSSSGYDDNNYQILWSQHQGGTNQSAFNLFRTGYWMNTSGGYITGDPEAAYFWSPDGCNGGNLYRVNLYDANDTNNPWSLDVGCTSASNVKAQVRCVKD